MCLHNTNGWAVPGGSFRAAYKSGIPFWNCRSNLSSVPNPLSPEPFLQRPFRWSLLAGWKQYTKWESQLEARMRGMVAGEIKKQKKQQRDALRLIQYWHARQELIFFLNKKLDSKAKSYIHLNVQSSMHKHSFHIKGVSMHLLQTALT